MQYVFYALMFVVGAVLGSFLCCQARRLRERELEKKPLGPRSVCMHCKYQLKWYDNIPIISWLVLRGKCRKCGKKIGIAELLSEIACATATVLISTSFAPETATIAEWLIFVFKLALTLSLCFLSIYDGLYGELPMLALVTSGVIAIAFCVASVLGTHQNILDSLLSAAFFGGIYLVLYLVSKGKWVGDGDWLLAGIIGLALGSVWSSFVALFLANLSASIIMFPSAIRSKSSQIHFGPFLVLGFVLVISGCVIINI